MNTKLNLSDICHSMASLAEQWGLQVIDQSDFFSTGWVVYEVGTNSHVHPLGKSSYFCHFSQ